MPLFFPLPFPPNIPDILSPVSDLLAALGSYLVYGDLKPLALLSVVLFLSVIS